MILILTSVADTHAASFAAELPSAFVLTCHELAQTPIRLHPAQFPNSTLSLGGRTIHLTEITAVLNLLPAVVANEFPELPEAERAAQAAAFRVLLAYLQSSLPCTVVNRPSPVSMTGTVPNAPAWFAAAAAAGIPLARLRASSDGKGLLGGRGPAIGVTYLGGRIVAASGTAADEYTPALARMCRLEYLRAVYRQEDSGIRFLGADSYPDIRTPATRAALRDYFLRRAA